MSHDHHPPPRRTLLPSTRREFLLRSSRGLGLLAFSQFAPSFLVRSTLASEPAPEKDRSILVLVQMAGGNDGLNTLVPYADDRYYRLRPTLAIKPKDVLKLSDTHGLHPACAALHGLFHDGSLAVVQNVGYPNPNRSHFRSSEIWETASTSDDYLATGWLGRYLDNTCAGAPEGTDPAAVHVSNELPQSLFAGKEHATFGLSPGGRSRRESESAINLLEKFARQAPASDNSNVNFLRHTLMDSLVTERRVQQVMNTYRPESAYPAGGFSGSLRNVAALIASGFSTRVYFVSLGGFDTHSNQANAHQNLLKTLAEGLAAFQGDLRSRGLDRQVLTMTFSEFGRRPGENESHGTDHGTAAPLFVLGSKVKTGLHGAAPSLAVAHNEDLKFSTDFRDVYATVLGSWLQCPATTVIGEGRTKLDFI